MDTDTAAEPQRDYAMEIAQYYTKARTEANLTIEDIAQMLRLGSKQIVCFELGNFEALPNELFVKGLMRNYAKIVHIDSNPWIELYNQQCRSIPTETIRPTYMENSVGMHSNMPRLLVYCVIIGAVIAGLTWAWNTYHLSSYLSNISLWHNVTSLSETAADYSSTSAKTKENAPDQVTLPITPEATYYAPTENAGKGGRQLVIECKEGSWIKVTRNNQLLLQGTLTAGNKKQITAEPPLQVTIGNASAVQLQYANHPIDLYPYTGNRNVATLTIR